MSRICPSCELETIANSTPSQIVEFNWKLRKHGERELFEGLHDKRLYACAVHQKGMPAIADENVRERYRLSQAKAENVFWEMTGCMSAAGKLGVHKYRNQTTDDWTARTFHICDDIMPFQHKERKRTSAKVKHLELKAINNPRGKLRPVLHKGLYKHNPHDFEKLRDIKKEIREAKQNERENRIDRFNREMDSME